jgi:ATP-binding cassette subfamily B protein
LTKIVIDRYLNPKPVPSPLDGYLSADRWAGLNQVTLLYLVLLLLTFIFAYAQTYLMQYTGQRVMFD